MNSNPFDSIFGGGFNPPPDIGEINTLRVRIKTLEKQNKKLQNSIKILGNILSDIPGNNITDKQKRMWQKLNKDFPGKEKKESHD